jgi:hypothetical protein
MDRLGTPTRGCGYGGDVTVKLPCGHWIGHSKLFALAGRVAARKRVKPTGGKRAGAGRPIKLVECRKCGGTFGTAEIRTHKCALPLPEAE